jgi:hypothetical protein
MAAIIADESQDPICRIKTRMCGRMPAPSVIKA